MSSEIKSEHASSPDGVLTAVADDYRRAVLRSLNRADEKWTATSTLVDRVSEQVRNGTVSDTEHRRSVRTQLHHTHLPKLEEFGMIVCDTETDRVRDATGELGRDVLALVAPYEASE